MRIVFSAGGTGGHLYPALALAEYIKSQDKQAQILFIGSIYRIEATKVKEYGFDFYGLNIHTPSGSLIKKINGYKDVFFNINTCKKILNKFKPDVVIGFGGYASYAVLKASSALNIPYYLHEQNSIIGKANHQLLNKAQALICAYPLDLNTKTPIYNYGNPVSYHVRKSNFANLNDYGLSNELPTILVVMGSQGSMLMDEVIHKMITNLKPSNYQLIYISGHNYYEQYQNLKFDDKVRVIAYEDNLPSLIKSCSLIISRAGASAITEIISANKPSILIPSEHVANDHQNKNAQLLLKNECVEVIKEAELDEKMLESRIDYLINNSQILDKMALNTKKLNFDDSALLIYQLLKKEAGEDNE